MSEGDESRKKGLAERSVNTSVPPRDHPSAFEERVPAGNDQRAGLEKAPAARRMPRGSRTSS